MKKQNVKNVLVISEFYHPYWTGLSKVMHILAKNLDKQGYSVSALTIQIDKSIPKEETVDNIKVIRVPFQIKISRSLFSISIIAKLFSIVRDFDVVMISSPNSNVLIFSIITKLFRKKLVIFHQGDLLLPRKSGNQFMNRALEKVFDLFTIPAVWMSDIASTPTLDYGENSRVIKHGLQKFRPFTPTIEFSEKKPEKVFKKKIDDYKKNHVLIGFAGRFVEEKGLDIFMQSVPFILKEVDNAKFLLAGKKMEYESFFEYAMQYTKGYEDTIEFLGLLDFNDLSYFYQNLDTFVISSRSDCFPTTQLEVMNFKVPVVVTDIPGARTMVQDTGFGVIVPSENPEELAKGIVEVVKNRKKYEKQYPKVQARLARDRDFDLSFNKRKPNGK